MARSARRTAFVGLALAGSLIWPGAAQGLPPNAGPSTVTKPYVLPVAAGVDTTSIFTVDAKAAGNGYEMTGIPDGLGAIKQGDDVVVFMNHELGQTSGTVRRHGEIGSFVSRLVLNPATLRVKAGKDWINPGVRYWDYASGGYASEPNAFIEGSVADLAAFARFCSADLTGAGQLFNPSTGSGFASCTSPTRSRARRAAPSRCDPTATPGSSRAWVCSRGRTRCRPPTPPTRPW